jgi:hypothetical protein
MLDCPAVTQRIPSLPMRCADRHGQPRLPPGHTICCNLFRASRLSRRVGDAMPLQQTRVATVLVGGGSPATRMIAIVKRGSSAKLQGARSANGPKKPTADYLAP